MIRSRDVDARLMFSHTKRADERLVEIKLSGQISGREYREICELLSESIDKRGRVDLFCELDESFRGITLPVMWRAALTATEGLLKLQRIAVVGERKRYKWSRVIVRAFHAETRYFDRAHRTRALRWLEKRSLDSDLRAKQKFAGDAGYRNQRSRASMQLRGRNHRRNRNGRD